MSRRAAFTLVELLVVIGIIALLIAILMPTLSRARAAAQETVCLSNLRSIGQGCMLHAQDRTGHLPLAGVIWGVQATPAGLSDNQQRKYVYFRDGATDRVMPIPGALARYLGQEIRTDSRGNVEADLKKGLIQKIFLCPSDGDGHAATTVGDSSGYLGPQSNTSYAFNEAALGWADAGQGGVVGHSRARGKLTKIPNSSAVIIMSDGLPRTEYADKFIDFYDHASDITLADCMIGREPGGTPSIFDKKRHRGRISILFADGHAEKMMITPLELRKVSLNIGFR